MASVIVFAEEIESTRTISMDFKEAALDNVLKILSQQSGLNFIAAEPVNDRKITLFLDHVPVKDALEKILSANNLTYEIHPGSNIFIVKSTDFNIPVTRIYYLKYATVQSSKMNSTISIDPEETVGGSQSSNSSSTQTSNTPNSSTVKTPKTGIAAAIKAVLTKDGNIIEDPRTNSLIVTDIPLQFPLIEQTIARLDIAIPQVLIEVEMLDISKEAADQMGVKFGSNLLTFKGGERDVLYPWNQNAVIQKGFSFSGSEYRVGTISAAGLTAALQFLRSLTDTRNLARPRILTLNNETAQIKISTNEAIGIKTQTQSAQGSATQSVTAERVETGIFLTVTPQANSISGDITMAIVPKVIQARTGGTFDNKTFKDPEERGSKSILRVRDGDTIILGGLLRTDYSNTSTRLPVLSDIPVLGAAFRHKDKKNTERELVIFITPHIVSENSKELSMDSATRQQYETSTSLLRLDEINKALTTFENKKK